MAVLDLLRSLCCCLMMLAAFLWFVLRFVFCVLLELCLLLFFNFYFVSWYFGLLDDTFLGHFKISPHARM